MKQHKCLDKFACRTCPACIDQTHAAEQLLYAARAVFDYYSNPDDTPNGIEDERVAQFILRAAIKKIEETGLGCQPITQDHLLVEEAERLHEQMCSAPLRGVPARW